MLKCVSCLCFFRLEEALSDCISAQKHMRGHKMVNYKQLGLRYKLYNWQVRPLTSMHVCAHTHTHTHTRGKKQVENGPTKQV